MTMQLILIAFGAIVTDQLLKFVSFGGNSSTAVDDCDSQGEAILLALHFIFRPMRNALTLHHTSFSGAPRGAFKQPVYNKYKVRWLKVLARPLQAVHNGFCLRH